VTINNKLKSIKIDLSFLDIQTMQMKEFLMSSFLQFRGNIRNWKSLLRYRSHAGWGSGRCP